MKIVADSNYFVALASINDNLYSTAFNLAKLIKDRGDKIYINKYIFLEIVTIISQKVSRDISIKVGRDLLENTGEIEVLDIDSIMFQKTWDIFQRVKDKNISFVDCSLIVLKNEIVADAILTFDVTDFTKLRKSYKFQYYK
ncbi:MAG: type II toxin-antitoxin system VapC family toxin [Patescibacteria group bacterium]